jgi:pimeloyl-ACP methyl ester carboxylesterase
MTPETRSFPGAERPARSYRHNADGVDIAVYEWGAESNPPLFLVHGGSDFAGTFDVQRRAEEVPVAEYVALVQSL